MKWLIPSLVLLIVVGSFGSLVPAQQFDLTQPQSPPRPAPKGLKIIDQGQFDPRLKGYFTPDGIRVEIVADYPVVVNPVGMTFADDGTLHVLEWRPDVGDSFPEVPETIRYLDGSTRKIATMKKHVKDVVKVLRATQGQGVYDEAQVVLEEELPSSILLHEGWLYVSGRGTVRRYRQSRDGGLYDRREVIAQGFCGFHHHQVSGLTLGNDGWLYITSGDDDNYVEGSDGGRATVLRTGAIFRCRPDGSRMQVYSIGYRNPYRDVAFDSAFNLFHVDNDNEDGSKFTGCRLMHVPEGSDFGWRLRTGARCCVPDSVRAAVFGELPGKMPALLKTGRGAPAGLLIYNDSRFPEPYQGLLYYPDVFRKLIRAYRVEPRGATFEVVEEFEFLKSDDPLFRPCQMVLGPDGAMYICDWRTDSGGAGRLWGDGKHGRIYRVSWAGNADHPALPLRSLQSWAGISKLSEPDLIKLLASADFSDRQRAQRELVQRGPRTRPILLRLLANDQEPLPARLAALGALQSFWNDDVKEAFLRLLNDREADLRRLAADGLALGCKAGDREVHDGLLQVLGDAEPPVRRAVALAIGHIAAAGAADCLVNAYRYEESKDVYLQDGQLRAIELLGKPGMDRLLALADSGLGQDRDKVVEALLSLRTRPAADALATLLNNPHLRTAQRANLLRSYANYLLDPPIRLETVLQYLTTHLTADVEVKLAGLEALSLSGTLREAGAANLLLTLLDDTDAGLRLSVIRAVEDARLAKAAPRLVQWLGDENRPVPERTAAAKALRALTDKSAVPVLRALLSKKEAAVNSALKLEAFRTLAVLDAPAARFAAEVLLEQPDLALQREAVQTLGAEPAGARLVAERFVAQKLPRDLLPQVSDALRKHIEKSPELGKLLTEVMRGGLLLSLNKDEVARVQQLVRTKGNAQRGKALYLNSKSLACMLCHPLEGVGGNVGPDLTRIWETHSVEKILEALIEPSKEIKEGYQAYVATTRKGQVYTGLKVAQTADEIVLRDATAKEVRLALKDVEELTVSKQSLMPDNVIAQLTFEQFLDLVAFLKDRPAQESIRGMALEYWVAGPFGGDLKAAYPPEANPDPAAVYAGAKPGEKVAWQQRQVESNGVLNLGSLFPGEQTSAYAMTYVHSPKEQKVQLLLGGSCPMRVWLNGKLIHEQVDARPEEQGREVTLQPGWNTLLVKVVHGPANGGLSLRFKGGEGIRVTLRQQ